MIIKGDCLEKLKELPDNSVYSIVTDPPYELGFMGKSWDNTGIANNVEMWKECLRVLKPGGHLLAFSGTRTYHRMACAIEDAGFEVRDMIEWVYSTGFPKSLNLNKALQKRCTCGNMEVYERTKQNTKHNLRQVPETDLPQTINLKDKQGEVLQSVLQEQSLHNEGKEAVAVLPISERKGQPSVEGGSVVKENSWKLSGDDLCEVSERISTDGEERRIHNGTQVSDGSTPEATIKESGSSTSQRPQSEQQQNRKPCSFCEQYGTQEARRLFEATYGVGSAMKPSHEPICVARKPISEKTLLDNFIKYGTGGINIDESRVGTEGGETHKGGFQKQYVGDKVDYENHGVETDLTLKGRFPANLIHDNSEEVRECFPESKSGNRSSKYKLTSRDGGFRPGQIYGEYKVKPFDDIPASSGSASRFFKSIIYQAKASKSERNKGCESMDEGEVKHYTKNRRCKICGYQEVSGSPCKCENPDWEIIERPVMKGGNAHPTVKPIALMEYLIKIVTPKGGTVLDPFMGSGSTGVACKKNGYGFIGIEMEPEYVKIAEARIGATRQNLVLL